MQGYKLVFSSLADSELDAMPAAVAAELLDRLEELARNPVERSRRARFPDLPRFQCFDCSVEMHEGRYVIVAFFNYSQDERSLRIYGFRCDFLPAS